MSDCTQPVGIAGRPLPAAFARRRITIPPRSERPYDPAEWWDSLVMVECGEVELDCRGGELARFKQGDILWLTGLPVCALRNRGDEPAVLVAVSRVRT
jgi:hypothetical protein